MKFNWFNLMPWPYLPDDFTEKHRSVWVDVDSRLFDARKAIDGLLASDWFVFWRCRELVGNGQLLLRGEADSLSTCELRRNVSVAV